MSFLFSMIIFSHSSSFCIAASSAAFLAASSSCLLRSSSCFFRSSSCFLASSSATGSGLSTVGCFVSPDFAFSTSPSKFPSGGLEGVSFSSSTSIQPLNLFTASFTKLSTASNSAGLCPASSLPPDDISCCFLSWTESPPGDKVPSMLFLSASSMDFCPYNIDNIIFLLGNPGNPSQTLDRFSGSTTLGRLPSFVELLVLVRLLIWSSEDVTVSVCSLLLSKSSVLEPSLSSVSSLSSLVLWSEDPLLSKLFVKDSLLLSLFTSGVFFLLTTETFKSFLYGDFSSLRSEKSFLWLDASAFGCLPRSSCARRVSSRCPIDL